MNVLKLQGYSTAFVKSVVTIGLISGAMLTGAASAGEIYFNGFETNTAGWPSAPTRVASGTNGISSSSGAFHATTAAGSGNYTNWGGYNYGAGGAVATTFKEYRTSLDIYLNVGGGSSSGTRFDWDSSINNSAGNFLSDFIFNGGFYTDADGSPGSGTSRFIFSASNNSQPGSAYAKNPARDPFAISTTGWYTFEHHFYNDGGNLKVAMNILDAQNDTLMHSWTFTGPAIAGVGGNRYGWFDYNEFSSLAIDNAALATVDPAAVPEPSSLALLGLGFAGLLMRRRKLN